MVDAVVEFREKHSFNRNATNGVFEIIRTERPQLYSKVSEELLSPFVSEEEAREMIHRIGLKSALALAGSQLRMQVPGAALPPQRTESVPTFALKM